MLFTGNLHDQRTQRGPVVDITVKSAVSWDRLFAPTWELVLASKRHAITWDVYTAQYIALMRQRYKQDPWVFQALAQLALSEDVTIACYCSRHDHCHRSLLAAILQKIATDQGFGELAVTHLYPYAEISQ
jgi:uncharacterized protein YeaO (DUF488 family)